MSDTAPDPHNLPAVDDRRIKPCAGCGGKLTPTFWLVQPVRAIIDMSCVRQFQGLATMLGNAPIARAMGGAPLAREFDRLAEVCVCETCACNMPLAQLAMEA